MLTHRNLHYQRATSGLERLIQAIFLHTYVNNTDTSVPGILVEQAGSGDSSIGFLLSGVRTWSVGVDNSDSDKFKIGSGEDLGTSSKMVIDTSGNVGIGITNPSNPLHVQKDAGASAIAYFNSLNADGYGVAIRTADAGNDKYVLRLDSSYGSVMYATNAGNVGIGTTSPNALLHVYKSSHPNAMLARFENPTGEGLVEIKSQNDALSILQFADSEDGNVGAVQYSHVDNSMRFKTSDAERMRINSSGNVGIGTTSPGSKLEVNSGGSDSVARFTSTDARARILISDNNDISYFGTYIGTTFLGPDDTPSGNTINVLSNGNVGIGTTSPGTYAKLEVSTSGQYEGIVLSNGTNSVGWISGNSASNDNGQLSLSSGGVQKVQINAASNSYFNGGNVGIGTTSPDFKLDVNGIIRSENSSEVGTLYLGNTAQSQIPGGAIIGQRSPSYSSTGNLLFQVPTWGAGTDYGLTTQMSIEVSTSDTKKATISMIPFGGNVEITNALLSNQENTNVDTGAEVVAQVSTSTYTAAFFDFVIKKVGNIRSGTVYACHDGTNVEFTETSTNDLGDTSDVTLSVDKSGTNLRLIATVTSDDWIIKSLIRAI